MKKTATTLILYTATFAIAVILVISAVLHSNQAVLSMPMHIKFTGEYSQNGGNWQRLDKETKLSAYEGDLTLRVNFSDIDMPEGAELRFYLNHIGMDIYRNGEILYESSQEKFPSMCGNIWTSWTLPRILPEDILEIRLHNPHSFGNRSAYNQFLDSVYSGGDVTMKAYFERLSIPYRVSAIFVLVVSVALIGTALGYCLLHLPDSELLIKLGFMSLMMGAYMYFDVRDISLWSGQIVFNTYVRRLAVMIAAWLMTECTAELLHGKRRKWAETAAYVQMGTNFVIMAVSFAGITGIYDTGIYWTVIQGIIGLILLVLTALDMKNSRKADGLMKPSAIILLTSMLLEFLNAGMGWWQGGICIKVIFTGMFVFHLIRAVWLVAKSRQDSIRAEKLDMELKNSRIVLAMSQIRTHFVFNILNAISGMCEYDAQKADETLVMFSRYLRRNINVMDKDDPEDFEKSLEYIEKYIFLEQVRFGDKIRFEKNIEAEDFKIPPLALQPLVENAIRHGLLHKKQGGTVRIHTWTENGDSIIEISDDGVGFDTSVSPNEESVGIKNVRFRLKYMVGGTMDIKSTPGLGTTVTIRIPGKPKNTKNGVKKK